MFSEVTDVVTKIKERAMEAMLPSYLPTKMKEKYLKLSHTMTAEQIKEVGERFRKAHDEAMEKFNEQMKEKERNRELLIQRMGSRN